jgi:hypothetical protein
VLLNFLLYAARLFLGRTPNQAYRDFAQGTLQYLPKFETSASDDGGCALTGAG